MDNTSQLKQHALVEAFKKIGIDVTICESNSMFSKNVLIDDSGKKYRVSKDLKVKPDYRSFSTETHIANVTDVIARKIHFRIKNGGYGNVKLKAGRKKLAKFGK